ncbi:DUF7521 family protein [Halorhabdus rudnickae]|uniref:DUF7521 family protein n=1 Tax=Halorhabdus rudnickae TaxID=1775544 RepID=UPI001083BCA8|nr:hypothetical protein [Halorhabdus rudnickae]
MIEPSPSYESSVVPMQAATAPSGSGELLLLAGGAITIAIGIAIAYVAFRGYRRNASRPMLFIAIGFVLAIAFPGTLEYLLYILIVAFDFQSPLDQLYLAGIMQGSQLLGMAAILYALLVQ